MASPITLEWDESGVILTLDTSELENVRLDIDGCTLTGRMHTGAAFLFYEAVRDALGDWHAEGETVRREFEQRRGDTDPREGYDASDSKHSDFHSVHSDLWDSREGK